MHRGNSCTHSIHSLPGERQWPKNNGLSLEAECIPVWTVILHRAASAMCSPFPTHYPALVFHVCMDEIVKLQGSVHTSICISLYCAGHGRCRCGAGERCVSLLVHSLAWLWWGMSRSCIVVVGDNCNATWWVTVCRASLSLDPMSCMLLVIKANYAAILVCSASFVLPMNHGGLTHTTDFCVNAIQYTQFLDLPIPDLLDYKIFLFLFFSLWEKPPVGWLTRWLEIATDSFTSLWRMWCKLFQVKIPSRLHLLIFRVELSRLLGKKIPVA